ncbi:MAG: ATP-grasp domain-containing protein [Polyangiaceae bacterium]|nr:ATP-grasp domain-containing protein [Polyangiaceae bacterium]
MRLIHAAREQNRERGQNLTTIAFYTEPDRGAMFVREADEAVYLGPAQITAPDGSRRLTYLDFDALENALVGCRADAVWVGWGFVSERPEMAELCERLGIVFIGPTAATMRALGDKISSKKLAEAAGVPVAAWSGGPVSSPEEALAHAERIGYPLMIKATAGGGGRGIREVKGPEHLPAALESARAEAKLAFGNPDVFLERRVSGARHIEVQIIGDDHGNVWAPGVRDCTVQRRHQKVIEEAPSPILTAEEDAFVRDCAVRLAQKVRYRNAGTVEFLFETGPRRFSFMEVNARLQVEHPVTEMTTGVDMVKLQLHVARGGVLSGAPPMPRGHAVEVRINAEDPEHDFAPAPGQIDLFRLPTGPGIRVDSGVSEGDRVPAEFDSMIAKMIAWGHTRSEALARLSGALSETGLLLRGGVSNKAFLLNLLKRPEVLHAEADNQWLDSFAATGDHVSRRQADVALLAVALDAYTEQSAVDQARFFASAARGRPTVQPAQGIEVELGHRGSRYKFVVERVSPSTYHIHIHGGIHLTVREETLGRRERRLTVNGRPHRVLSIAEGIDRVVEVDGTLHRISRDAAGTVRAQAPAVVLRTPVKQGDLVREGDPVAVLEAMKMEMTIGAPISGRVREVLTTPNVHVDAGTPLVVVEPLPENGTVAERGAGVEFSVIPTAETPQNQPHVQWEQASAQLERLLLGYDLDENAAANVASLWKNACAALPVFDSSLLRRENEILETFADVQALFRRRPAEEDENSSAVSSTEEHLFMYLRSVDSRGAGLPSSFIQKLSRALARYGVHKLDPSAELREALVRLFKARARGDEQAAAVTATLHRRQTAAGAHGATAGDSFHVLVNRLAGVARRRFPAVHEAALEVRHTFFEEPMFRKARDAVRAQAVAQLLDLESAGIESVAERAARIDALVECPEPLFGVFAPRLQQADPVLRGALLEVLVRRYYRIRALSGVEVGESTGCPYVGAEYPHEGRQIKVIASCAPLPRLAEIVEHVNQAVRLAASSGDVVVDFYTFQDDGLLNLDDLELQVRNALLTGRLTPGLRRVVVVAQSIDQNQTTCFTFRPEGEGYVEDRVVRGLHPMLGKRMHLWRLSNFNLTRLPSADDVYLFHGVAKQNPKDERLFAIGEVRDLTPVRDTHGHIIQLPYLERVLGEATAAVRLAQSARPSRDRLVGNRVLLYLWPPLRLTAEELRQVTERLAPETEGLGIDQVVVRALLPEADGTLRDTVIRISNPMDRGLHVTFHEPSDTPVPTHSEYDQKVLNLKRRGLLYPYETIKLLTPETAGDLPRGEFEEYDLNEQGQLVPVKRPYGQNQANIVVGVIRNYTPQTPEGFVRVVLLGDAGKEMGSLAEPECRRILTALDLAEKMQVPLEWFALSAGAKISKQSGTENMDWISAVLQKIVLYTQRGGEINVIVCGINVGAQPYWNAEATMLMHTRGILVMLPEAAMVLTGKQALDYSGSVSAEDNLGIGGYERIMGPNGQAQYFVRDIGAACALLMAHYQHTYVVPGERFPRPVATADPIHRDVRTAPHPDGQLPTIGDVFGPKNADRKRAFDIRAVMGAVIDQDHAPLERWRDMRDAEVAVVWDAHLGGYPVCLLGIESHPLARAGFIPADGPEQWTAGTLFPRSSKKIARAVNAASGKQPLVVLANLSGFDGSPDSMRNLQLEYGAEIGRAVVNFQGPIVFVVVSRYHGGAFVVFSKRLNPSMEVIALEGARASVIGGAPAAAVVFAREVDVRTAKDPRVVQLETQIVQAPPAERQALRAQLAQVRSLVHSEMLGKVADEFDHIHSVERAKQVGSLDTILPVQELRPYLIKALERGIERTVKESKVASTPSA